MPITLSVGSGDGINIAALRMNIQYPDNTTQINVQGVYQPPSLQLASPQGQQAVLAFSATATSPGPATTWTVYWNAQLVPAATTVTVASSTSAMPVVPAGNVVLFQQSLSTAAGQTISMQPAITIPSLVNVAPN